VLHYASLTLPILAGLLAIATAGAQTGDLPPDVRCTIIPLQVASPAEDTAGGMIAADIDDDGAMELLVTAPGYLGAYRVSGERLWSESIDIRVGGQSESHGLPGHHGPGVQAGDVDADGHTEVVFLTQDDTLHFLDGATGKGKATVKIPHPEGADRWEHGVIANFRGKADTDILLQATNRKGYRMGRYVAAFAVPELLAGRVRPLWQRDDFLACAHNGARVADLDGDGRDEVIGGTILGPEGDLRVRFPVRGHLDSVFIYDVRPELPGLEVVTLEEGGKDQERNRVFVAGGDGLIYQTHFQNWEPQNAAVGRFSAQADAMFVWCRSRFNEHQKPFVFDAHGKLVAHYEMDDVAPDGWTASGVEVINCIDWTGQKAQLAAAKERHTSGDLCVFNPLSGEFLLRIAEKADRFYVADVTGDWREELIAWNEQEIHIYENTAPNPRPDEPRLWTLPHYRRSKMTWNYYSP